jgi:hypothetical protein
MAGRIEVKLLGRCAFDTTLHSFARAMVQLREGLLHIRKSKGVFAASVRACLKALEAIFDDGQQRLLADAVHASFGDRTVLKVNVKRKGSIEFLITGAVLDIDAIVVICAAYAWLI